MPRKGIFQPPERPTRKDGPRFEPESLTSAPVFPFAQWCVRRDSGSEKVRTMSLRWLIKELRSRTEFVFFPSSVWIGW